MTCKFINPLPPKFQPFEFTIQVTNKEQMLVWRAILETGESIGETLENISYLRERGIDQDDIAEIIDAAITHDDCIEFFHQGMPK